MLEDELRSLLTLSIIFLHRPIPACLGLLTIGKDSRPGQGSQGTRTRVTNVADALWRQKAILGLRHPCAPLGCLVSIPIPRFSFHQETEFTQHVL